MPEIICNTSPLQYLHQVGARVKPCDCPGVAGIDRNLDDALARRLANGIGIKFTGTLGIFLDAKKAGLVDAVSPLLDRLQERGFRLAAGTREAGAATRRRVNRVTGPYPALGKTGGEWR